MRFSLPHRRRRVFSFFDFRSSFSRFSDFIEKKGKKKENKKKKERGKKKEKKEKTRAFGFKSKPNGTQSSEVGGCHGSGAAAYREGGMSRRAAVHQFRFILADSSRLAFCN